MNLLLSILHDAPERVIFKVFNSSAATFMGFIQAWRLSDKNVDQFYIAWNRAMRLLLKLRPATHCRFLSSFTGWNVKVRVTKSSLGLIKNLKNHRNSFIRFVGTHCSRDMRSIIGSNEAVIPSLLHCGSGMISTRDESNIGIVMELRECINGSRTIDLETDEIEQIIKAICTD